MKQLLIRADDIGYSYAVNVGIARTVHEGLIRSVGVMPNMPETARGVDWVRNADIAIGQHTNLCLGTPCSDPASIPSLVDENGQFKSSRTYREAFKRGEDFVVFEEAVVEIEAQRSRRSSRAFSRSWDAIQTTSRRTPWFPRTSTVPSSTLHASMATAIRRHRSIQQQRSRAALHPSAW